MRFVAITMLDLSKLAAPATLVLLLAGRVAADPVKVSPAIAARMRSVRVEVVAGRIGLVSPRSRRSSTSTTRSGNRSERLTINTNGQRPTLQYDLTTPQERLKIRAGRDGRFEISYHALAETDNYTVEFSQRPNERLTLVVHGKFGSKELHADGLWQMQLSDPAACREHLNPLLELLRADWNLAASADAVEQLLLAQIVQGDASDRARWKELVAQLASDDFSRRRAADRQLREAGPAVVPFLQSLDRDQLDAEQWFRIRRMIASFTGGADEDTPESVVRRLAPDPRVWYLLLSRDDPAHREHAAARLSRLLGYAIDFDPTADEATRLRQIEQIGRRIVP